MKHSQQAYWLVAAAAVASGAAYVGLAAALDGPGFPLDDAWIHQTYARNLVRSGRWEYVPGVVSAGSTAPLWTLLLAIGYLMRLPPLIWSTLLGMVCLVGLAWSGMVLWRQQWPEWGAKSWLAGLALATTWPFIWAAASGMETLLFASLAITLLASFNDDAIVRRPWWPGLLSGLLVLTRPEGILLVALVGLSLLLRPKTSLKAMALFALAAALPLIPYFLFNWRASGHLLPNTFYAKQLEYAIFLREPFPWRLGRLLYFSLGGPVEGWRGMSGAHLLLLPGLVVAAGLAFRSDWRLRRLQMTLPLMWAAAHVFVYAWRLPVTYQHGRYLWAAIPIWLIYGLAGWLYLLARPGNDRLRRILRQVVGLTYATLAVVFLFVGGRAYAMDVAFIEGEMVTVAHWLRQNTAEDALVAAHDIGAIGYFAERPLLDLAGLISPEVLPFLADEEALARYVAAREPAYLVTAPGWPYALLTDGRSPVFSSNYEWTQRLGVNNMMVYTFTLR